MAVIKPPITGDPTLDSWTNQITQTMNAGVTTGSSPNIGARGSAGASGFNTATISLFARTTTNSAPAAIDEQLTYTYSTTQLVNGSNHDGYTNGIGPSDVWFRKVNAGSGDFVWTTTVSVADTNDVEIIAADSWSAVALLSTSGENIKNKTFVQDNIPTALAVGDLWIDTNDNNKVYVAKSVGANEVASNEWVLSQDSIAASALANSKATVFRQSSAPSALAAGDIWFDTDDNNEMYIASGTGTSNWVREDFAVLINGNTTTIDGGKITASSVTAGQMAAQTITAAKINSTFGTLTFGNSASNVIESSGFSTGSEGWQIKGNGDAEFNDLTLRGIVSNTATSRRMGFSGAWLGLFRPDSVEDILSSNYGYGAGAYAFILVGAGGAGGGGSFQSNSKNASGGGGGGIAFVQYQWDGSTNINFGLSGSSTTSGGGTPGGTESGSTATLQFGSTLGVTCTGGGAGTTANNGSIANGGAGGTATINSAGLFTNTVVRNGGDGGHGGTSRHSAGGGGGVPFIYGSTNPTHGIGVNVIGAGGGGTPLKKTTGEPANLNQSNTFGLAYSETFTSNFNHWSNSSGNEGAIKTSSGGSTYAMESSPSTGSILGSFGFGGYDLNNFSNRLRSTGMVGGEPQMTSGSGGRVGDSGSGTSGYLPFSNRAFCGGGGGCISAGGSGNAFGGGGGIGGGGGGAGYSTGSGSHAGYGGHPALFILKL